METSGLNWDMMGPNQQLSRDSLWLWWGELRLDQGGRCGTGRGGGFWLNLGDGTKRPCLLRMGKTGMKADPGLGVLFTRSRKSRRRPDLKKEKKPQTSIWPCWFERTL